MVKTRTASKTSVGTNGKRKLIEVMKASSSEYQKSQASSVSPKTLAGVVSSVLDYARYLRLGFLQPLDETTLRSPDFKARFLKFQEEFGKDQTAELLNAPQRALVMAPFSILPAPMPKAAFNEGRSLMEYFNVLMHRVANDYDFLKVAYANLIKVDDFQAHLWRIYETVKAEGVAQSVSLQVNRNDFFIERCDTEDRFQIRQVEINLFASSFGYFAERVHKLHRFTTRALNLDEESLQLAPNENIKAVAQAFVSAWRLYGDENAAVLFVIQQGERNIMDQRAIEYAVIKADPRIRVIRRTLQQINEQATFDKSTKQLRMHININDGPSVPIAVVYFRSGYTPKDYPDESCWQARLLIEQSNAIKCPNIAYHLANSKRVQQCLSEVGVLEHFLAADTDASIISRIRSTFADQYSLDNAEAVDNALADPDAYVLKPNLEGGGSNLFHQELADTLRRVRHTEERYAYTLMKRIHPFTFDAFLYNAALPLESALTLRRCCFEFGVYGILLGDSHHLTINRTCGYLIRTKQFGVDEGGIASGFAALDSAQLV